MEVNRMKTIRAKVNPRLLSKADRLFTGTVDGRIIEILQNARRVEKSIRKGARRRAQRGAT
jgi:hypothetical protein